MDQGRRNHKDVEYLVRLEPEVTHTRQESLRYPGGIEGSAQYVEAGLNEHPVHGGLYVGCVPARHQEVVTRWDHTKQTQAHKHQGSHRSVRCCGEPVHHGDGDGPDAQDADDDHVDHLGEELAVEAVVDPGDEA